MDFNFGFGEMTIYERSKLYKYIIQKKPKIIFESGTGKGGSTYVMINASDNDTKIYSCDPERAPNFKSDRLFFYKKKSEELIGIMLENKIYPDFIFFDGPEEPEVALNDFKMLENIVEVGTIFSMHDWCTNIRKYDNNKSTKARYLKDYLNSLENWQLIEELDGENYKNGEESVGLVFYKKVK